MLHWVITKAVSCYWWNGYVLSNSNVLFYSFILYNMWIQSGEVFFRSGRWHSYWSVSYAMLRTWVCLPSAHEKRKVVRAHLHSQHWEAIQAGPWSLLANKTNQSIELKSIMETLSQKLRWSSIEGLVIEEDL